MSFDPSLTVAGLVVGLLVGLTGMGGGALLTPLLVLFFRVSPLAAVSSDLVTSLVMKPVGAAVHVRHRTVHWGIVGWLAAGSVPAGFAGAVLVGTLGRGTAVQSDLKVIIGVALCASVGLTILRAVLDRRAALRPDDRAPQVLPPLPPGAQRVVGGHPRCGPSRSASSAGSPSA